MSIHRPLDHFGNRRESRDRPSRKRSTATSLAAFSTTGRLALRLRAPDRPAAGTETPDGRAPRIRALPTRARSRDGKRAGPPIGIGERVLNRQPHVGDAELRDDRAVDELNHRVHDRLRVNHDVDLSARTPKSQWASITSRPLFISVAESMVIFRPIRQVGCRSASAADTLASSRRRPAAKGPAGGGQHDAASTSDAARPCRH